METILQILDVLSYFLPIIILKIRMGKLSGNYGFVIISLFLPAIVMMIAGADYAIYWGVIFALSVTALGIKE